MPPDTNPTIEDPTVDDPAVEDRTDVHQGETAEAGTTGITDAAGVTDPAGATDKAETAEKTGTTEKAETSEKADTERADDAAKANDAGPEGDGGTPQAGPDGDGGTPQAGPDEDGSPPQAGQDGGGTPQAGPDGDGSTPPGEADRPGSRPGRRLIAAAAVSVVILGALGGLATWKAHSLRAAAAQRNVALTDRAQTSAVAHQVASAVNTIFSYSYADTGRTRQAAQSLLTGPAIRQYDRLFSLVQSQAPKQKLVVTTRVTSTGVEFLAGGRARLLVFANQQDTKAGTTQSSYAGAMFAVTAIQQNGRWKIESIDTFTGS